MVTALRHAFRRWRHRPALAITAMAVLAIGVGATTAMFSIVDAVLLQDEPWPDAGRLVRVFGVQPQQRSNPAFATRWNRGGISWASWRDLQRAPAFSDVAVWVPGQYVVGAERPELVSTFFVSSTLPGLLGGRPAIGRFFTIDEDEQDPGTLVISHRLWTTMFGGDPDVVGRATSVTYPGQSAAGAPSRRTIVGVLPADFAWPGDSPDALLPIGAQKYNGSYGTPFFLALARLAPGTSIGAAADAADPLVRREEPSDRRSSRVVTLRADRLGGGDASLWLLFAGAALLLVVACSNVAGLLLSDAHARRHETAVRLTLGGTRLAVLRQLALEHALLAAGAGAGGVLLAGWLVPALVSLAPPGLIGAQTVALNGTIAAWSVVAAVATTFLAGLIPAAVMSGTQPGESIRGAGRQATTGGRWRHRTIVAAQFALALVLLVGAGLFGETVLRLGAQPLGFTPDGVVVAAVSRGREIPRVWTAEERADLARRFTDPQARRDFYVQFQWSPFQTLLDRLASMPDLTAVALADRVPFGDDLPGSARIYADGQRPEEAQLAQPRAVTEGYFRVMGIPILRGRGFEPADRHIASQSPVLSAVISDELERRLFNGPGLGRTFRRDKSILTVVGVVPETRDGARSSGDTATYYQPMLAANSARYVVVRASADPGRMLPVVRTTIESHTPPMFVTSAAALRDRVDAAIVIERGRAMLSSLYGGIALLLATVGLYGLAARLVTERRREIGIRVALGAGPQHVRRLVMSDAWLIVGVGLTVGLPSALIASRLAEGLLYGVAPGAVHVFGVATGALAVAAVVATLVPALRASRIDPAVTLREE